MSAEAPLRWGAVEGCEACGFTRDTTPPGLLHEHSTAWVWGKAHKRWLHDMVEEQRGLCVLCGEPMAGKHPQPSAPSRDHLWPMLFGGPHAVWNEAAAHAECNGDREEAVTTVVEQVLVDRVGRAAVDGMYEHTQRVFGLDMRWHTEYLAGVQAAEAANRASHELTQDDDGGNRRMCLRCGAAGRFTYERPCEGR